jgi:hypothetical protein
MPVTDWAALLRDEDVEGLWNALYRLVSRHPAVRPLRFTTDEAAVSSQTEINADLTQELFLELLQKQRFDHYLARNYTSAEIENELTHIEVPNMVGARLRQRYPESFRMARRISSLLKSSPRFRSFDVGSASMQSGRRSLRQSPCDGQAHPRRQRMVNRVFGLREWPPNKPLRDPGRFPDLIKDVPVRQRDTRIVGRAASSQIILSNRELEQLIVEILMAIDSPADVRTIRQLVLSKMPLQDYRLASLDSEICAGGDGSNLRMENLLTTADTRETPEAKLLRDEKNRQMAQLAEEFLKRLRRAVNNNERRYQRLIRTLWHCYYDPQQPSQLLIAHMLGVSDSLVSDNRRLIEHELKKLRLSVEEGRTFSESLLQLITRCLERNL